MSYGSYYWPSKTERTTGAFEFSQHSLSENRLPEAAETASVTKAAVEGKRFLRVKPDTYPPPIIM